MYSWFLNGAYGPTIVTFIGAVLVAFGVLWSSLRQQELSRMTLGGDSYCYVRPHDPVEAPESLVPLVAFQVGRYPVYDVDLFMADLADPTPRQIPPTRVGTLAPAQHQLVTRVMLPASGERAFVINAVSARNGGVTEVLKFAWSPQLTAPGSPPDKGGWLAAWKVIRQSDWKVVEERVPQGFPRGPNGKVNWGVGGF
ncbi:MAG: hypothetical protein WA005_05365 [Candidatus Binataceae bacterium]